MSHDESCRKHWISCTGRVDCLVSMQQTCPLDATPPAAPPVVVGATTEEGFPARQPCSFAASLRPARAIYMRLMGVNCRLLAHCSSCFVLFFRRFYFYHPRFHHHRWQPPRSVLSLSVVISFNKRAEIRVNEFTATNGSSLQCTPE